MRQRACGSAAAPANKSSSKFLNDEKNAIEASASNGLPGCGDELYRFIINPEFRQAMCLQASLFSS